MQLSKVGTKIKVGHANRGSCMLFETEIGFCRIKVSGLDSNLSLVLKHDGVCLAGFGERFYPPKLRSYV